MRFRKDKLSPYLTSLAACAGLLGWWMAAAAIRVELNSEQSRKKKAPGLCLGVTLERWKGRNLRHDDNDRKT